MNKPIKAYGKDEYIKYYNSNELVMIPTTYKEKDKELRGVWFSTVANIDIPRISEENNFSPEDLKLYLKDVIATLKKYHMNTVIFQVRPVNDALYSSTLNPYSSVLTGFEGKDPTFDVFEYFIEEAKKASIQTHAWINPYRAGRVNIVEKNMTKEQFLESLDELNFARRNPDCTILTKDNKVLLDPSSSKVREFVSDSIIEIATKYDIKAVHIDDYFYPYEGISDSDEEMKFRNSGFSRLEDFRRNNVDLMIELIHNKLSKLDRTVEFGISPFGIYRTNSSLFNPNDLETINDKAWIDGSNNHPSCTTCYANLYADVYKWMEKGWIDYVVPQAYWDLYNTKVNDDGKSVNLVRYADVVKWWSEACKKTNCKLYIGQALYRVGSLDNWLDEEEIDNELLYNQNFDNVLGTIFFTYKDLKNDKNETVKKAKEILLTRWTKDVSDL